MLCTCGHMKKKTGNIGESCGGIGRQYEKDVFLLKN